MQNAKLLVAALTKLQSAAQGANKDVFVEAARVFSSSVSDVFVLARAKKLRNAADKYATQLLASLMFKIARTRSIYSFCCKSSFHGSFFLFSLSLISFRVKVIQYIPNSLNKVLQKCQKL